MLCYVVMLRYILVLVHYSSTILKNIITSSHIIYSNNFDVAEMSDQKSKFKK